MCVNAAQTAKAVCGDARSFQVRQFDTSRITDDDIFDITFTVNERADLPACFVREFGELSRKLGRDDLLWRDAP